MSGGQCYRINQVTLSLVTTLGTRARLRDVTGPSATNRSAVTASVRSAPELQTKVREDFKSQRRHLLRAYSWLK